MLVITVLQVSRVPEAFRQLPEAFLSPGQGQKTIRAPVVECDLDMYMLEDTGLLRLGEHKH